MEKEEIILNASVDFEQDKFTPKASLILPYNRKNRLRGKMIKNTKKKAKNNLPKEHYNEFMTYVYGVTAEFNGLKQLSFIASIFELLDISDENQISNIRKLFHDNDITSKAIFESGFVSLQDARIMLRRQVINSIDDSLYKNKKLLSVISNLTQKDIQILKNLFSYCFTFSIKYLCTVESTKEKIEVNNVDNKVWISFNDFGDKNLRELKIYDICFEDYKHACDLGIFRETSQVKYLSENKDRKVELKFDGSEIQNACIDELKVFISNFDYNLDFSIDKDKVNPTIVYHQLTEIGQLLINIFQEENMIEPSKLSSICKDKLEKAILK